MRSQTLSGWPSDTDSLVKTKSCFAKRPISLSIRPSQMHRARHSRVAISKRIPYTAAFLSNVAPRWSSSICQWSPVSTVGRAPAFGGQLSRQLEQPAAHRRVADRIERLDELDRLALAQRVGLERLRRRLGEAGVGRVRRIEAVVKEPDPDTQYPAEVIQPAGADAVGGALVFLHLLKGEPQRGGELLLAHPLHGAAQPDARADMDVDRVRLVGLAAARPPRSSESAHKRPRAIEERKRDNAYIRMQSTAAATIDS